MQNPSELELTGPEAESQLATQSPTSLAPIAHMLQSAIDKGTSPDALEKLVGLYERMEDRHAEKQFAAAFEALQNEMPKIKATEPVPNNDRTVRYRFAPLPSIMDELKPFLKKHGFTIFFSSNIENDRVTQTCTVQHVAGHKRSNQSMARIGRGPPKASEAQADGAAATYAKRQALCDAFNIVIEHDNDAQAVGDPITPDEVQYIKERLTETGTKVEVILEMAFGLDSEGNVRGKIEEITSEKYPVIVRALSMKARRKGVT